MKFKTKTRYRLKACNIIVSALVLCTISTAQNLPETGKSSIDIACTTNVNSFSFHNSLKKHNINTFCVESDSTNERKLIHKLSVETIDFKNDDESLKKEFLTLLKYKEFPFIEVVVRQVNSGQVKTGIQQLPIELTITGVKKLYLMDCDIIRLSDDTYSISGKHCIHLKDFGLEPPSKFFGLVRVNNDVIVTFVINTKIPQHYYDEIQH